MRYDVETIDDLPGCLFPTYGTNVHLEKAINFLLFHCLIRKKLSDYL